MMHCASGKHIDKVKLTVRKRRRKPGRYMVITLEEVLVTSLALAVRAPMTPMTRTSP